MAGVSNPFHYPVDYHVQALPISLATTLGISVDFFSCSYLDVSVRRVRFACLCIQHAMTCKGRVSPFGNLRIKVCLLTPRSLSQATTSFIACNRQGIHHVHLFACPYNVSPWLLTRERYSSRSTACCMFVDSYYYPKCALLHARLKKLYFFQIVKERNSIDL